MIGVLIEVMILLGAMMCLNQKKKMSRNDFNDSSLRETHSSSHQMPRVTFNDGSLCETHSSSYQIQTVDDSHSSSHQVQLRYQEIIQKELVLTINTSTSDELPENVDEYLKNIRNQKKKKMFDEMTQIKTFSQINFWND